MTLDEALQQTMVEIDRVLRERLRTLEFELFRDGLGWEDIDAVTARQRRLDAEWRADLVQKLQAAMAEVHSGA